MNVVQPEESAVSRLQALVVACPHDPGPEACAARLRLNLDMMTAGIEMMRMNLGRQFPLESEEVVSQRVAIWLRARPGAQYGDGVGLPAPHRFASPADA